MLAVFKTKSFLILSKMVWIEKEQLTLKVRNGIMFTMNYLLKYTIRKNAHNRIFNKDVKLHQLFIKIKIKRY